MNTGKIITDLRKEKKMSQSDLAKTSGVSREMIGRYERNDAVPSIEAAKKIADAFGVSLDFLVGEGINALLDKKALQRLQEIQNLDSDTKGVLYNVIDTYLRDAKARQAYLA